jgi:hypothetical protein
MTMGLLTKAGYWETGDAELPPPPRRYVLRKCQTAAGKQH